MPSPDADGDTDRGRAAPVLSALDLRCRRGGRLVLAGLNFELRPGELLELRGANGSGKTTLLRLLAGLAPLTGGTLAWGGQVLRPGDAAHARRVAYLGHLNGLSADLTATENLRFARQLDDPLGAGGQALLPALVDGPSPAIALQAWGLAAQAQLPVGRLSQGQRRRLALARVWMARRPLWLLDEPCAALDAAGERLFDERLTAHLRAGGSAVVATHRALDVPAALLRRLDLDSLPRPAPARLALPEDALAAC